MPRKARITIPGAVHHIMSRGIEGCRFFRDDNDRQYFKAVFWKLTLPEQVTYYMLGV